MSFGAISKEAHEALALAMNKLGGRSNTGEVVRDNDRFHSTVDGISLSSKTKQIASGRFGVTTEYLVNAEEIQIKVAQGPNRARWPVAWIQGGRGHRQDPSFHQGYFPYLASTSSRYLLHRGFGTADFRLEECEP